MFYNLQPETRAELRRLAEIAPGTVAHHAAQLGADKGEPLLVGLDALLRYAKAHRKAYDQTISADYVGGPYWLAAAKGFRDLLNFQGGVALELDRSTDSKDNGTLEEIFWAAMEAAGFTEADL